MIDGIDEFLDTSRAYLFGNDAEGDAELETDAGRDRAAPAPMEG